MPAAGAVTCHGCDLGGSVAARCPASAVTYQGCPRRATADGMSKARISAAVLAGIGGCRLLAAARQRAVVEREGARQQARAVIVLVADAVRLTRRGQHKGLGSGNVMVVAMVPVLRERGGGDQRRKDQGGAEDLHGRLRNEGMTDDRSVTARDQTTAGR